MPKTLVCDGNEAAAWGVALARPDMVAVYPITHQSSLAEYISQFMADGIINADLMDVEDPHSDELVVLEKEALIALGAIVRDVPPPRRIESD